MAVIASKILLASVSFIEPTAGASYIEPTATASYIQPVVRLSYIQAVVTAEVTMPDVLSVEVINPLDDLNISFNKSLVDTYAQFEELFQKAFSKPLSDNYGVQDSPDIILTKLFKETQALTDKKIINFGKNPAETLVPLDLLAKQYAKKLVDVYSGFTDKAVKTAGKGLKDTIVMEDDTDIEVFISKILAEIQATTDKKALSIAKAPFLESLTFGDARNYVLTKAFSEIVGTPVDNTARVINKALTDSVTITEVLTTLKIYIRAFADSVTVPDADSILFTPGNEQDSASVADASTLSFSKNQTDTINLIDGMDGDLDFDFIKVISELVAPLDAKVVDFQPTKADNVLTSSSGILVMQDYCDITYFLEDYVGTSRSFT